MCTSPTECGSYGLNGSSVSEQEYFAAVDDYELNDLSRSLYTAPDFTWPLGDSSDSTLYRFKTATSPAGSSSTPLVAQGSGVSIFWLGESVPTFSSTPNVVQQDRSPYYRSIHAKLKAIRYAQVVASLAPSACITGVESFSAQPMWNPYRDGCGSYYLGAHTFTDSTYAQGSNDYSSLAAVIDDYIYNNRVTVLASVGEVSANRFIPNAAGASHNAITVDAPDPQGTNLLRLAALPQVRNVDRVELSAPKIHVQKRGANGEFGTVFVNQPKSGPDAATATAYTAGQLAGFLSDFPFYRWHPEVVRALLLTCKGDESQPLDYQCLTQGNISRYWMGENESHFQGDSIVFDVDPSVVNPGDKWNVAIAWLTHGDYALNQGALQQELTLTVELMDASGNVVATYLADNRGRGHQALEITLPAGTAQARSIIRRTKNKGARNLIGYNLHITPMAR